MVLIPHTSGSGTSTTFTNADWVAANSPAVVELGEGWEVIGISAFQNNSVLTSITIPASVTSIGVQAFLDCYSLTGVVFEMSSQLHTIGNYSFVQSGLSGTITIPASVTSIGENALAYCSSLTGVVFESGSQLQTIGYSAFTNSGLRGTITIPDSVTSIREYAFYQCSSLTGVVFESGSQLQTIGDRVFLESGLSTLTIPDSLLTVFGVNIGSGGQTVGAKAGVTVIVKPVITSGITGHNLFHESGAGQIVYTITATDNVGIASYAISGRDAGLLSVDSTTGVVTLTAVPNYETKLSYSFTVTATAADGNTSEPATVTFSIVLPVAPICFPAGTPVLTDQGEIAIEKIDPKKHTIRANKIEGITETTSIENYVVMIKKDAFARNVPCRDTTISANHKIMFNNQMIQAREFVDKKEFIDTIYKVDYTGETLYNVLLEDKHDLMIVNNLIAETLSPNSVNAWLFRKMESDISIAERKEVMDAYMQRVFPSPVLSLSSFMIGCK